MSTLGALLLLLLILITIVGGKTGLKSYLSIVLNFALIILVAVLIGIGTNILLVGVIFVPLKLLTIIYLGTHDNRVAKISFLIAMAISAGLFVLILILEYFAQAGGFGDQSGEELVGLSLNIGINYQDLGILVAVFSTLGAIAEAAVAMSAGMLELLAQKSDISLAALKRSGTKIGEDILGTALNTILFGMFGSFLPLFIWFIRLHYSIGRVVNDKLFVSAALIMVYSIVGVLLTIPAVIYAVGRKQKLANEERND